MPCAKVAQNLRVTPFGPDGCYTNFKASAKLEKGVMKKTPDGSLLFCKIPVEKMKLGRS